MGVVRRFQELANTFDVIIEWVPGHSNIRGNEASDASARAGLSQLPQPDTVPRVYLRQAISKLTAPDSLPTPPPTPSKSFQMKRSEIPNPKLPNRPIIVATPIMIPTSTAIHDPTHVTQPRENSATQSSWATVIRNGQKKARVTKANISKSTKAKKANHVEHLNEPIASSNSPRRQALEGKSTPPDNADKRTFLRFLQ
ncbi:hypothetical protein EPUL_001114 [Erysiphe pulchra]|uniref:RNase H type-1 domain-containing protein n=1 Tax=Erysiphe pulchra TaxID=225359 RepID=A0A2S4PY24_9PEZI|nr:hypothetical protein EPUL_001114 [Erysiphe pulchra]